ncbi:hypothetical protein ACXHQL_23460 [Vibrio parahaemolyticus]|uniref:hypothetical protein n=1 Tax=Vibrio parahaemolyticus TaxID=670 RepID=UPI001A2175BF|nr:hypothetical protein [Vibrio parahaemolyticus]MCC3798432.1 hypothetical protein [Vibrio parahaemolyticus]MCC3813184.1 hypothetical protein [Vibrio parahaemolyticus]HAS7013952.1 hypothetical protein [Vibrio parahaemolyticus]
MTIGVHHKKKFASDSQITVKNNLTDEVIDKILDPGFNKIQVYKKKRKGKKPDVKKTIQFAGSVLCYREALKGLVDSGDWKQRKDKIEELCLGSETEKPKSFHIVFSDNTGVYEWGILVDNQYQIFEISERQLDLEKIHAIGSGSQTFGYSIDSQGIFDLDELISIAIKHDTYCGGDIIMCKNVTDFKTHGEAQLAAVESMLGNVAQGCVAEASLNAESHIKRLQRQGVELKPRFSAYKAAQKAN